VRSGAKLSETDQAHRSRDDELRQLAHSACCSTPAGQAGPSSPPSPHDPAQIRRTPNPSSPAPAFNEKGRLRTQGVCVPLGNVRDVHRTRPELAHVRNWFRAPQANGVIEPTSDRSSTNKCTVGSWRTGSRSPARPKAPAHLQPRPAPRAPGAQHALHRVDPDANNAGGANPRSTNLSHFL
jgi:hypothetical protein